MAAGGARAQETADCSDAVTQVEMTGCAEQDWQNADAELNIAYKAAMAKMQEIDGYLDDNLIGAAETLREAQRAWIPYRDKTCEAYGFLARGGSLESQLVYGCLADLTRQRTGELNDLTGGLGN
ncbi:lysozyme inhibitor LprI family protein [Roseibium salinum]|nr:lysozyme inhibitor LprI family protein [Roseibium salinum]